VSDGGLRMEGGDSFAEGGERSCRERVDIGEGDIGDVVSGDVGGWVMDGTTGRGLTLPCDDFLTRSCGGLTAPLCDVVRLRTREPRSSDCFVGVASSESFLGDMTGFGGDCVARDCS
jgi:hypothetical protein